MDINNRGQPWGKLVNVNSSETVLLFNRECTVGRKKGCHLSFPANKLVSGEHCKIVQDENSGLAWLEDMSTNGTVINMSKLVKKQTHMLQNGDVIYFVYRKSEPEQNIAYVYHSINVEHSATTHDPDGDLERSDLSSAPHSEMSLSVEPVMLSTAPRDPTQEEPQPSTSSSNFCIRSPTTPAVMETTAVPAAGQAGDAAQAPEKDVDDMEPESKRRKTDDNKDYDLGLPHASGTAAATSAKGSLLSKPPVGGAKTDKMEESLTCVICQDLLHDCVSLQPCMHVFCAACYSGWMERSSLCPTCRCPVERIRKNHVLNNLVEAYLIQHPEKCRSEEDLKSMDSRNKITQDMLQPKVERSYSDEEGSSDFLFELSDNDSDSSDISQPLVICRQCPGYRRDVSQMLFTTGSNYWLPGFPAPPLVFPPPKPPSEEVSEKPTGEQPSTSSDIPSAAQDPKEYRCPPQGLHLMCTCCLQPMPDRQAELNSQQSVAQQCALCQRPFCHMYWGCQRIGCQGCLARFSELNLTDKCLDGVLNNNNFESEILQNYLTSRGKSWRDLLQESLQRLQQGQCYLTDSRISANTIMCFCCGLRAFKELAYKYRQSIPSSELPAAVASRPDCYWGRNCRTQVKAHHAMKFNHICEQTRFKS
ncbi:E3 ubiquitin-protein ligase CHFR [Cheilinus undulatus]|uniref:E3 ubiquitin-protein ligase CHFR n=1 Tax=Cheilinus undulatus TaxID=241271 RepID=UPI001BD68985|nr:E3 ubiquitin-protein ligase CHFR [Cheilinus undulatus]